MPTYDYQCRSCGTVIEVIHPMTADGLTVCERCGGELRRVLYPAGIIFKGSGFYSTDSRSSSTSSSPAGTSAGTTSTPKAEAGTDSTTATTKPTADAAG